MRRTVVLVLLPWLAGLIAALAFVPRPVMAHHSFAAEFTAEETLTLTGVVTEVWFRNPHVRYYVDVTNEAGDVEQWDTRGSSPSLLTRRGWTKDSIRIGDRITLKGHRAKDPERKLLSIIWIELADGTRLE